MNLSAKTKTAQQPLPLAIKFLNIKDLKYPGDFRLSDLSLADMQKLYKPCSPNFIDDSPMRTEGDVVTIGSMWWFGPVRYMLPTFLKYFGCHGKVNFQEGKIISEDRDTPNITIYYDDQLIACLDYKAPNAIFASELMKVQAQDLVEAEVKLQRLRNMLRSKDSRGSGQKADYPQSLFLDPSVDMNTQRLVQQMIKYSEKTRWVGVYDYDNLLLLDIPRRSNTYGASKMPDIIEGYLIKEEGPKSTESRLVPAEYTLVDSTLRWISSATTERCTERAVMADVLRMTDEISRPKKPEIPR